MFTEKNIEQELYKIMEQAQYEWSESKLIQMLDILEGVEFDDKLLKALSLQQHQLLTSAIVALNQKLIHLDLTYKSQLEEAEKYGYTLETAEDMGKLITDIQKMLKPDPLNLQWKELFNNAIARLENYKTKLS